MGTFTVYLRTNKINGKQYVGQTNNYRKRNTGFKSGRPGNSVLEAEIKKYGLDVWTSEILAIVDTREEAWELERKYIKELNTRYPNGYNLSEGGKGCKGKPGVWTDKKMPKTACQKMSKNKKGKPAWNKGVKNCFSEETLRKMSELKKGKIPLINLRRMKPLDQISPVDGEVIKTWDSIKEACENGDFLHSKISDCCNGKRNKHKDYLWRRHSPQ